MGRTLQEPGLRAFGSYLLVEKLTNSAMHALYKGRHASTGATVTIKIAADALTRDPVMLKRFELEFRATSSICHQNIVRGLDFGWEGARPYIVMEWVDGEALSTRIARLGRLPEAEAIGYITQVARGLHEAHKHGIIHRDIKPDNILLTADGQAKLAELGLSKDLEAELELTRPGLGLGTPNFIAPEQFSDAKHAGVRCDIYSLGATLYMALTGELPFAGLGLAATLRNKLADDLAAPRRRVPSLSEHVDWAVRRAVLADPSRRFGSCPELIAALAGNGQDATDKGSSSVRRPARRMQSPERERRAGVRYECTLPTACTVNDSLHPDATELQTQWDAQVLNLSVRGIGLVLARRFEPGSVLTVDLASSDGTVQRTRQLHVVRVAPANGGRWYVGGVLTEKLSREELRLLL